MWLSRQQKQLLVNLFDENKKNLSHNNKSSVKLLSSQIISPFQGKKVIKSPPPLNDRLINRECNTSCGGILDGIFMCGKLRFIFYLQLHDLQLHVPELFHFGDLIPSS